MSRQEVQGQWVAGADGGNLQHPTWQANPIYALRVDAADSFTFSLTQLPAEQPASPVVGLTVLRLDEGEPLPQFPTGPQKVATSLFRGPELSDWRVPLQPSSGGRVHLVVVATADPGVRGAFSLVVQSDGGTAFTLEEFDPSVLPPTQSNTDGDLGSDGPPPVLPAGLEPFGGWESEGMFGSAVATARQQVDQQQAEGYTDGEFEAYTTNAMTKKREVNPKVLYISGQPPSGSSATKVDSWSRMSAIKSGGSAEAGAQLHLRNAALDDSWLLSAVGVVMTREHAPHVYSCMQGACMHVCIAFTDR